MISGDTHIGRTTEVGHAVEGVDSDPGFDCPGLHLAAAEVGPDDLLVAPELSFAT